ncbi:ATP-dependent helicase [Lishizhenia sp.]|uniref:ATP-dependent helicase n=1 Tax=Lishizhenia sp. TaxID=2497594 RepID=UPI00299F4CBD|nr:UvrD-helicase domain-containing protein [Lishizhenia sp.]MDX1445793.1 3'-5' exonuclease [Lishizhenia sp.]
MDYLEGLNKSQRVAVEHIDGPIMVIAGAGSGKTRVLTYRIAHMMNRGIDSFNILALTFTNKAAREMKERISQIVGDTEAKNLAMGTFHSVFAKLLRYNAEKLGYPSNFTIYDTQDSRSLIKSVIKELKLDDKDYKPNSVHGRISSAKNNLISPEEYANNAEIVGEDRMSKRPLIYQIYKMYMDRCFKAGAMDFDDLLYQTNVLLRDFPEVLHHYQQKFKYILVDEYQDTNYSQYLIVKKLAAVYENICVVGDDAQSIYSFRGANIQNILNFKRDYPDFKLYKLEQNYRSTKTIVDAANSVIEKNQDQIKKNVWTDNNQGDKIRVIRCLTDNEEGKVITNSIYEIKQGQGLQYSDFAILYRTNAQSRSFEESLRKLNMPYKIYGGLSFYQRKEIKDLIAYFRLSANSNDEEALKRVINYPKRGIGNTTMEHIIIAAQQYDVSLWEVMSDFNRYPCKVNASAQKKISDFVRMMQSFTADLDRVPAFDLAQRIATTTGLLKTLHEDKTPEGVTRYENIQELLAGVKEFSIANKNNENNSLSDFLIDVALMTDADDESEDDKNKVTLMTIHASKGLEFPHVYVVGLEENLFPSQLSINSRTELEEERRLFYVAITRAEKNCTLSYVQSRFRFGQLITSESSRFIDEIDEQYLNFESTYSDKGTSGRSLNARRGLDSKFSNPAASGGLSGLSQRRLKKVNVNDISSTPSKGGGTTQDLKVGYNVMHDRFGKGRVTALEGSAPNQKATVFFPRVGNKTLILKFAKLEVLD